MQALKILKNATGANFAARALGHEGAHVLEDNAHWLIVADKHFIFQLVEMLVASSIWFERYIPARMGGKERV